MFLRHLSTVILLLLISTLFMGCTRDRATAEVPNDRAEVATTPGADPDVVLLPVPAETATPVPQPTVVPTPAIQTQPYMVQPGDTVSTIAEQFGTTSQVLRELNLLTEDTLQPGQLLRVPNTPAQTTADTATPAVPAGPYEYTVQAGDTLLSIAIEFGVSTNEIVAANTLGNPNALFVGQKIIIPGYQPQPTPGPTPVSPYEYVIKPGDTLSAVAQQFGIAPSELLAANQLRDPNNLIVGQVLFIPGYRENATAIVDATRTLDGNNGVHTVRAGETLFAIAQRYGVTVAAITEANNITNPNLLAQGQQLVIPGVSMEQVEAANRIYHTVSKGEGLYGIATQYGVSVAEIAEANNLIDPNQLHEGQRLLIPQDEP